MTKNRGSIFSLIKDKLICCFPCNPQTCLHDDVTAIILPELKAKLNFYHQQPSFWLESSPSLNLVFYDIKLG
jgi:hypothetical protein